MGILLNPHPDRLFSVDASAPLTTPDHDVFRTLCSLGVPLEVPGISRHERKGTAVGYFYW